jgi:tRNA modification GTPase
MARAIPLESTRDTIVAPATAAGAAAVAIVRLSGPEALRIAGQLAPLADAPAHLVLRTLREPSNPTDAPTDPIDQALVAWWRGPHSYTGEDLVELHLHGSPAIVARALTALCRLGARLAAPGEFTRRAYLNGRLDLAQAEAVAALTRAQTDAASRSALAQLSGGLSRSLQQIRQGLLRVTAELEARLDFPDEDLPPEVHGALLESLQLAENELAALLHQHQRGQLLHRGIRVVLAGTPNAGKSSLFNALLGRERAITSPHPGTTRDTLEATLDLAGIPLTLVDTAGLRLTAEAIEALGIQRSREELHAADLVLFLVDPFMPLTESLAEYAALTALPHRIVFTKQDLPRFAEAHHAAFAAFAKAATEEPAASTTVSCSPADIVAFERWLLAELGAGEMEHQTSIGSPRHQSALTEARSAVRRATETLRSGLSHEFAVIDLSTALSHLSQLTGHGDLNEEVLDLIFSTFCLGK